MTDDEKLAELEEAKYELNLARQELYRAVSAFVNDPCEENTNRLYMEAERYQYWYDRVFFLEEKGWLDQAIYLDLEEGGGEKE
jgi:hypothetical protein